MLFSEDAILGTFVCKEPPWEERIKMDTFELSVISKAAAISAIVTDVTLGPNSPEFDMNESGVVKSGMLLLNNSIMDNSPTSKWNSLDVSHTSLGSNSSGEFDSQFSNMYLSKLFCEIQEIRQQRVKMSRYCILLVHVANNQII
uniref:Uncharacterized protein n=1 Tax=Timema monikensis TaxID=170555 RepID=A0A7R9HR00_9NEOP|nr:unnamed protein product [Timema monikensis]